MILGFAVMKLTIHGGGGEGLHDGVGSECK